MAIILVLNFNSSSRVIQIFILLEVLLHMRKSSLDKGSVLSLASINSFTRKTSVLRKTRTIIHRNNSVAQSFISNKEKDQREPLIKFRIKRKEQLNPSQMAKIDKPLISRQIQKAQQEIAQIKKQIRRQRSFTEGPSDAKLDKFISVLRDSVGQKQNQPIYYPIPMPFPFIMQNQHTMPPNQSQPSLKYPRITHSRIDDSDSPKRNLAKLKEMKAIRIKKNMSKWRRAVNAVIFIHYFQRFCNNVQYSRRVLFDKFLPKYSQHFKTILKKLREKMNGFFKLMLIKNDYKLQIDEGESKEINRQKVTLMRGIIKMILEGVAASFSNNEEEMTKFLYFICRHGNFSCTQPLLTKEELELCCISGEFKYTSGEINLQKVAIINTIFIKALIYGIFLSHFQLSTEFQTAIIKSNLLLVSSVLYEVLIDVQDDFLLKVPKSYQIGNYDTFDFVKSNKSMIAQGADHRSGELISGLKSQEEVNKYFHFKEWIPQKKIIKILLNSITQSIKKFHAKLIERHF